MKLMHLSDLHLGKRLIDVSMLEDQVYILGQIAQIAGEERPEAVLISGDVYDRSNPPAEAMSAFAGFLEELTALGCRVFVISGNHDSPERVAYLGNLVRAAGVHLAQEYAGHLEPIPLQDEYGPVLFWLMPYVHPEAARQFFPEEDIACANDAARLVLGEMRPDPACRNVILSHQFISGSSFDALEQRAVGSLDNVDPELYAPFDYVALGHIHRAQSVGRPDGTMRYCGTPLKYSRKEVSSEKTVTLVELGPKGDVRVRERALRPLREVRAVRGLFQDLLARGPEAGQEDDYYFVTLTDETDQKDAKPRLQERFPRMLTLDYDNARTRSGGEIPEEEDRAEDAGPLERLTELYRQTHGREMSEAARAFAERMIRETEEDDL